MGRRQGLWVAQEQRNREILSRHEAGETFTEVASEYGVSNERIRQIVRQLGIPGPGSRAWSSADTAILRRLWRAGYSASLIAKRLGVTKGAVTGRVNRLNLPARPTVIRSNINMSE